MKKKLAALLLAVLMAAAVYAPALSATGSGGQFLDNLFRPGIAYDAPSGYALYGANDVSASFVRYGPGGTEAEDYSHVVEIGWLFADDHWVRGIQSGSQSVLEDELVVKLDDNLHVGFVTLDGRRGIRIEEQQDGRLVEVTYYLLVEDYLVRVLVMGYPENIPAVDADANALIGSIRVEYAL